MLDSIRGFAALVAAVGITITLTSFYGGAHPAFDTFAAFRVHLTIGFAVLLIFALVFSAMTARYLSLIGLVIAAAGLTPALMGREPVAIADMRAFSHNLRFDNPTPRRVAEAIRASDADFVMLQEVSESNRVILDDFAREFPTRVLCDFSRVGGVAVLSRHPMIGEPGCARGQGIAWARLRTPDGPVTAVSIHLPWPWPYGTQARQAVRVAEILADLEEPVVIAGDFNNAAWSHAAAQIRLATGTRTTPGLRLTLQRQMVWPGLPLDHALVSEDLVAASRMLGQFGSDHHALLTELRWRGGA